jgi:hypothetical protein
MPVKKLLVRLERPDTESGLSVVFVLMDGHSKSFYLGECEIICRELFPDWELVTYSEDGGSTA